MAASSLRPVDPQAARADAGRLVLRVAIGLLVLLHGIAKLSGPPDVIVAMLAAAGLPGFLAYGVYIGEILAPLLLIVGVWTRAAAAVIVVNMIAAVYLAHLPELFSRGDQGGYALELQALYLFGALALCFLGGGRYSVGGRYGPMN